jgi:hypothetical protein
MMTINYLKDIPPIENTTSPTLELDLMFHLYMSFRKN